MNQLTQKYAQLTEYIPNYFSNLIDVYYLNRDTIWSNKMNNVGIEFIPDEIWANVWLRGEYADVHVTEPPLFIAGRSIANMSDRECAIFQAIILLSSVWAISHEDAYDILLSICAHSSDSRIGIKSGELTNMAADSAVKGRLDDLPGMEQTIAFALQSISTGMHRVVSERVKKEMNDLFYKGPSLSELS